MTIVDDWSKGGGVDTAIGIVDDYYVSQGWNGLRFNPSSLKIRYELLQKWNVRPRLLSGQVCFGTNYQV